MRSSERIISPTGLMLGRLNSRVRGLWVLGKEGDLTRQ